MYSIPTYDAPIVSMLLVPPFLLYADAPTGRRRMMVNQ
jgi:hypothetical protein